MNLKISAQKEEWVTPRLIKFSNNSIESTTGAADVYERVKIGMNVACDNELFVTVVNTMTETKVYLIGDNMCNCTTPSPTTVKVASVGGGFHFRMNNNAFCS